MARLTSALLLFGLLGSAVVSASPYDQVEQNRDATCDNGCFFSSFDGGCAEDAACMCDQTAHREAYFCCMAEKCDESVLPDSIVRRTAECEARNMPFGDFDVEAVCGITLSTSSTATAASSTGTGTATTGTASAATATDSTAASTTAAASSSSTASLTSSGTASATATSGGASSPRVMAGAIGALLAVSGMMLL
ncbi:hypothetical protein BJ166DRAFT_529879 [Pestalotiopsis sp. NC0098]|nr:hypothetical protein BJ166DRAFT_529879 [Pestalotiopsis sp. NC0098]